jgi:TldD protein
VIYLVEQQLIKEVLDKAMQKGGDFGDIYIEQKRSTAIRCEAGKIEKIQSGVDIGAGVRVISGEATAYAYTNDLSREGLLNVAGIVSHAAAGAKKDINLDFTKVKPLVEFSFEEKPSDVDTYRKVEAVLAADQAARAVDNSLVKQVIVGYGMWCSRLPWLIAQGNMLKMSA